MANSMERTFRRSVIMNLTNFKFEIEFNEFICRNLFIFFFSMRRQAIFIEEGNFFLRFPSRDTARLVRGLYIFETVFQYFSNYNNWELIRRREKISNFSTFFFLSNKQG